jgi:hypothetical protein
MPFDFEPINKNLRPDSDGDDKNQRIDSDTLRDSLQNNDLNEVGRKRLEALNFARAFGFSAAAQEFQVSEATLYRWQNKLKSSNGNAASLNGEVVSQLDVTSRLTEILAREFPEEVYVSRVKHPELGVECEVVDLDMIKRFVQNEHKYEGKRVRQESIAAAILDRHAYDEDGNQRKVLTTEQVENGDYNAKPLFYYPRSLAAAVNHVDIADSKFHLPLWELTDAGVFHTRESEYPTKNAEKLTAFEAKAALHLFHPDYGDGRRSLVGPFKGRLMVRNPDYDSAQPDSPANREREPLSRDLLKKYGLLDILQKPDAQSSRSIRAGMEVELPHLLENGALFLKDIRQVVHGRDEVAVEDFDPKDISSSSYVMYGSVNHYVGRKFAGDKAKPFSDERAAVMRDVNGTPVLVAAFNLISRSDASAEYLGKVGNIVARANGPKTQPKEINYERLIAKNLQGLQGAIREDKIRELQRLVTERFTDLVTQANRAAELVTSEGLNLTEQKKEVFIEEVRSLLLRQADRVIQIAVSATDAKSLKDELETYTFDKRAFVSLVQSLGVEAMLSNPLREIMATDLTQKQKGQMVLLLRQNYEALYPGDEHEEFRMKVEESLLKAFEKPTTKFYVLEDNGQIVSFNRFDDMQDGTDRKLSYFGSFNADSSYRGVGSEMLEKTIEAQMQRSEVIFAHCDPHMAISQKYIEDGFVATQTETVAGHFSFEIWRSNTVIENLATKQMSKEDLVAIADESPNPTDDFFVRRVESDDRFLELDSGLSYLLTRYFTHEGKTYAAFELNSNLSKEFTAA